MSTPRTYAALQKAGEEYSNNLEAGDPPFTTYGLDDLSWELETELQACHAVMEDAVKTIETMRQCMADRPVWFKECTLLIANLKSQKP